MNKNPPQNCMDGNSSKTRRVSLYEVSAPMPDRMNNDLPLRKKLSDSNLKYMTDPDTHSIGQASTLNLCVSKERKRSQENKSPAATVHSWINSIFGADGDPEYGHTHNKANGKTKDERKKSSVGAPPPVQPQPKKSVREMENGVEGSRNRSKSATPANKKDRKKSVDMYAAMLGMKEETARRERRISNAQCFGERKNNFKKMD